jgi:thymidine kinase
MNDTKCGVKSGLLEVICGSMFSGKTEELMRRLKRAEIAKQNVLTIKHQIDNRKTVSCISSHDGRNREAFSLGNDNSLSSKILELANKNVDVIGIDEVQFFSENIVETICKLIQKGNRVVVSGLDLDFRGNPFGVMPDLMALADKIVKLKAVCAVCFGPAHHTQRLIDGKPAKYDDPVILVGAQDFYEARCRNCFELDRPTKFVPAKQDDFFQEQVSG